MKALLFPGQGSQYEGMGRSLYENFDSARDVFMQIDEILGYKLSEKCFSSSQEELKDTSLQQLAIMAVSLAAYRASKQKMSDVSFLSGLSLGEYSCLYAGNVISLKDLVILVRERAKAMQEAALQASSTMLAVLGAGQEDLKPLAENLGFFLANINSASQVVISLKKESCQAVASKLQEQGYKVIELQVSGGFHSPFMAPAKDHLSRVMSSLSFKKSEFPIVSNYTGRGHTDPEQIKENLLKQLVSPVLWKDCVDYLNSKGVDLFFEVGPSKVLKGLIRKINPKLKVINIEKREDIENLS
ncbi:MAG: ACP S-malonyltransferase [Candidatus Omnitrophica bacterium]|nr:ACP S-malonyltransferase [Candidatus Omnitrophota bacterium]